MELSAFGSVTQILRGYTFEQVRGVAEVLVGSRVKNMEITLNTEGAFEIIKRISKEFSEKLNIGAGTVLDLESLKRAIDAGATFVLSPDMMDAEMIEYCRDNKVICVPGAYTPTEIHTCFKMGADIVKVFPANELSYSYAKKVCEPLGDYPLMAVGGVSAANIAEVFSGGYAYAGSAGGVFKKADILSGDHDALASSLAAFEQAMLNK